MPLVIDFSTWGHVEVTGPDHVRFLQGLTTVNLNALATGQHGWGAILSPKGRVLSVIDATRLEQRVLLHCEPALVEPTVAVLERHAIMDDVAIAAVTLAAHQVWTDPAGAWTADTILTAPPGATASPAEVEVARVEAGLLRYGVDIDQDGFPFETPLAAYLDSTKGCYVGQEPVFRVHAKGQAARVLRGLLIDGDGPVAAGAAVGHRERAAAGAVTSSVVSPRLGAIAMAYLHRSVWEVGGTVEVEGRPARVSDLPFSGVEW